VQVRVATHTARGRDDLVDAFECDECSATASHCFDAGREKRTEISSPFSSFPRESSSKLSLARTVAHERFCGMRRGVYGVIRKDDTALH